VAHTADREARALDPQSGAGKDQTIATTERRDQRHLEVAASNGAGVMSAASSLLGPMFGVLVDFGQADRRKIELTANSGYSV
jgi:hypothetical protein